MKPIMTLFLPLVFAVGSPAPGADGECCRPCPQCCPPVKCCKEPPPCCEKVCPPKACREGKGAAE